MTQSVDNMIINRIYGKKRGWVFTPNNFFDLGSRAAIDQSLSRLAKAGTIRRLSRGLYDYPEKHRSLGELPPNYERIVQALTGRDNIKIQPSGAYAANMLGLSEQVPARIVFLTDGKNKKIQVNKHQIILKNTTPKNMATAGRISGVVIHALRYLKQENVNDGTIDVLRKKLSSGDKRQLIKDIRLAPVWIGDIFRRLQD